MIGYYDSLASKERDLEMRERPSLSKEKTTISITLNAGDMGKIKSCADKYNLVIEHVIKHAIYDYLDNEATQEVTNEKDS